MKTILLFLSFVICSYCKMFTYIRRNLKKSLPTTISEEKYFYIMNSDYYSYSNNIYICFEDNGFVLDYENIKYRFDNNAPDFYPYIINSSSFITISTYYRTIGSSGPNEYCYTIPINNSYIFSIIYYNGRYSSGSLNVTTHYHFCNFDYNSILMKKISEKSGISLPTTIYYRKHFYVTNSYYLKTKYIYICFEDNNFSLDYNDIKYCYTNTSLYWKLDIENAIMSCSFNYLDYYSKKTFSNVTKYYYMIPNINSHSYTIIYYDGKNDSGSLKLTSNFYDLSKDIKMTQVTLNSKKSLPINYSYNKFFYFTNSEYNSPSKNIYFCLEDKSFALYSSQIQFGESYTNPSSYLDSVNIDFYDRKIRLYKISKSLSGSTKYYYRISPNFNNTYSIIYYDGHYSSGNLYVTSDYNDLFVEITKVNIHSYKYLPTRTPKENYFYLTNSDYYSYSSYVYFYLEEHNFNLNNSNIKYCYTNIDPNYDPKDAINNCSFTSLSFYDSNYYSTCPKYYYKFPTNSYYNYSIIYYEGFSDKGYLYIYCDYKSLTSVDNSGTISTVAIVAIAVGSFVFFVIFIIILICCCKCPKKSTIDFIPVTQPNNIDPEPILYPPSE